MVHWRLIINHQLKLIICNWITSVHQPSGLFKLSLMADELIQWKFSQENRQAALGAVQRFVKVALCQMNLARPAGGNPWENPWEKDGKNETRKWWNHLKARGKSSFWMHISRQIIGMSWNQWEYHIETLDLVDSPPAARAWDAASSAWCRKPKEAGPTYLRCSC